MSLTLDLSGVIDSAINEKLAEFDLEGKFKELLGEVAKTASKTLVVKMGEDGVEKKFPLAHKQFEDVLNVCAMGLNIVLTGGAGLSKTTAVEQVAEALDLDFTSISFSNQTTKTDLYGFVDANGVYRQSAFVDAFSNGKMFLADEMDACSANVLVLLNSAIENGFLTTADDRTIYAHKNFRFIGTANTNLRGAKDGFSARNKLDAATINRFAIIKWELDEELEQKICGNDAWLKIVRKCRQNAEDNLEEVVITPRSSYNGSKLLRAGIDIEKVIAMVVTAGMSEDEVSVLLKGVTENMKSEAVKSAGFKRDVAKVIETKKVEIEETPLVEIEDDDVADAKFDW